MKLSMLDLKKTITGGLLLVLVSSCGSKFKDLVTSKPTNDEDSEEKHLIDVPVNLLDDSQSMGFQLAGATAFSVTMDGCASGYTSTATDLSTNLQVYKYDQGCLAKLTSFDFGGKTFVPTAGTPFTTWLAGDFAIFRDTTNAANTLKVSVTSQLANPVSGTEPVTYTFSQIVAGTDQAIPNTVVGDAHTISVTGQSAPSFTVKTSSFTGMTATGGAKFQFTLECTAGQTGTGVASICVDVALSDIKYKLVEDTFGGVLTIANASSMFTGSEPGIAVGDVLAPGAGGTVNGGFITTAGASILTGPDQMHSKPNMLLVIQAANASYLYFNVDITTLTQN